MRRSSSSFILVFIVISCVLGRLYLPDLKKEFDFYQFSKVSTFPNSTVILSQVMNNTDYHCLFLEFGLDCGEAKSKVEKLDKSDDKPPCVIIPFGEEAIDLQDWIVSETQYIDTSFPIGLLLISQTTYHSIKNPVIRAQFGGWDPNARFKFFSASITIYSLLIMGCIFVSLFGVVRLYQKYLDDEFRLNISTVCIGLEITSCVFRLIENILAIMFAINIYTDIPNSLDLFFSFIPVPFTLSSGIFLIFLWLDITSESLYRGAFLDKLFYPAIIFVVASFIFLFIGAILNLIGILRSIVSVISGIILFFLFIIAIIYFIAAYKIEIYSKTRPDVKKNVFNRMIGKILASGTVMIIIVILAVGSTFARTPIVKMPMLYMVNILFVIRSYLLIDIFYIGRKSSGTASTSEKTPKSKLEDSHNNSPPVNE